MLSPCVHTCTGLSLGHQRPACSASCGSCNITHTATCNTPNSVIDCMRYLIRLFRLIAASPSNSLLPTQHSLPCLRLVARLPHAPQTRPRPFKRSQGSLRRRPIGLERIYPAPKQACRQATAGTRPTGSLRLRLQANISSEASLMVESPMIYRQRPNRACATN